MLRYALFSILLMFGLGGCASSQPPIRTESSVDLSRFMGDWYVIANIPTFIEKGAHNAIESYEMNDDGTIATKFRFRQDSFDGEIKTYHPTGFVEDDGSNAVWGMQFIWPIKADYRIVYLNDEYTQTIIGRQQRDYVWIMARTPNIAEKDYNALLQLLKKEGYEISKIQKVPQQWPE
ncbi:MAG: lipocalin family protein [Methylophaga sp.]|nr:lipocalin family protein [Methylophaga sp.]